MRYVSDVLCREYQNTLTFTNFFPPKNASYCEIIWKNKVEPDRPQMTIKYDACALHAGYLRLQTRTQSR